MEKQKTGFAGFFKGLLIGAVVFGTLALFTAPHSGAETRQMMREKGIELRNQAAETIENVRGQMDTAIAGVRQRSAQAIEPANPV